MKIFATLSFILLAATLQAQSPEAQLDSLIKNSNRFKTFKVVPRTDLDALKNSLAATLEELREDIASKDATIAEKKDSISTLTSRIAVLEQDLTTAQDAREDMVVLGQPIQKGVYHIIVWGIIGALFLGLVIVLARFKSSNSTTKTALKQLETTEQELEELRRRSIEKEQKLGRQLQDERNKLARLQGK